MFTSVLHSCRQFLAVLVLSGITLLARLVPIPVDASTELERSLDILSVTVSPATLIRGGYGAGLVTGGFVAMAALFVPDAFRTVVVLTALSTGVLTTHVIHSAPVLLATARRTSALGAAPDLVSRVVLRMRLSPTPERAAVFAAETDDGLLTTSLQRHVRAARGTGRSGLASFGDTWVTEFPSLRRSFSLVEAAGHANETDRAQLLDRALTVVLDGTSDQMQEFATHIQSPVTALYAFGVLLPTALVALLPAAGTVGVAVTPLSVIVAYNLVLPVLLIGAAAWLLARRPVAFPPPRVSRDHPDVEGSPGWTVFAGVMTALGTWFAVAQFTPAWGPPIGALGLGLGVTLWLWFRPVIEVHQHVRAVENGLADALELIGRQVTHGKSVEAAIAHTAEELDGPMSEVLAAGVRTQRQLQLDVREAFLGQYGALSTVPSARARGSLAVLSLAATEGRPAGGALLALAEHVDDLGRIEREARHRLAHVTQTIASTGSVFGPLVAGVTVALASAIGSTEALGPGEQSLGWLGGPVGVYVLVLAVVLTVLSTGLIRGFDRSLLGVRVGRALISATVVYLGSYLVAGVFV